MHGRVKLRTFLYVHILDTVSIFEHGKFVNSIAAPTGFRRTAARFAWRLALHTFSVDLYRVRRAHFHTRIVKEFVAL